MKRKILLVAVIIIFGALLGYGSVAYFSATAKATNVITMGSVNLQIVEQTKDGEDGLVPYASEPISAMPGVSVDKIVTVKNTGKSDAWVRAQITVTVKDSTGTWASIPSGAFSLSTPDSNWLELNGSYYYTTPLTAGASTGPLLETVSFSAQGMGNEYQGCTVEITITAQALQARNVPLEANGLPAPTLYPNPS